MEEDEDIVLEGGCLHQHLQQLGFSDFEVIPSQNKKQDLRLKIKTNKYLEEKHKFFQKKALDLLVDFAAYILDLNSVETAFQEILSVRVICSKLCEENDLLILETLSPSIQKLSSDPDSFNNKVMTAELTIPTLGFSKLSYLNLILWSAVLALILSLRLIWEFSLLRGFSTFLSLMATAVYFRFHCVKNYQSVLNNLNETINIIKRTNVVLTKCLKHFNLLRVMKRSMHQLSDTFYTNECVYEAAVCQGVVELVQMMSSVFVARHLSLKNIATGEGDKFRLLFSDAFKIDVQEDSKEDFYQALKAKRDVINIQVSAFIAELFLCYELSRNISIYQCGLKADWKMISGKVELVERTLNLCNKYWLLDEPKLKGFVKPLKSYETLKSDVKSAVDELSIHCRLIAYYALHLNDTLEQEEHKQSDNIYQIVNDTCNDIQNEILSCSACVEEVVERNDYHFSHLQGKRQECSSLQTERLKQGVEGFLSRRLDEPTDVYDLKDPVIEDEIFEAVVHHHQTNRAVTKDDEVWLESYMAEKQVKRKQRERCKRVLQEIQPILQKRRQIWQERETKALRRMQGLPDEDGAPIDATSISGSVDSGVSSPVGAISHSLLEELTKEGAPLSFSVSDREEVNESITNLQTANKRMGTERAPCTLYDGVLDGSDSEEERLEVYRRVKKELDEDEARRRVESEEESSVGNFENESLFTKSKELFRLPSSPDEAAQLCTSFDLGQSPIFCTSPSAEHRDLHDSEIETNQSLLSNQQTKNVNNVATPSGSVLSSQNARQEFHDDLVLNTDFKSENAVHTNNTSLNYAQEFQAEEEDHFSCGDSDEEGKVIDWSTCGFTLRRKEDQRRDLPFAGFSSILALNVVKNVPDLGKEEVFGGSGEGETEETEESE